MMGDNFMFVDEYQELHDKILAGDDAGALAILSDLDEMSRDDKINKIESFMRVLLVHLVKREAEGRTTGSWDKSIKVASLEIAWTNRRRKAGGRFLDDDALVTALEETWPHAVKLAAIEVRGGRHTALELAGMVSKETLLAEAFRLVKEGDDS